MLVLGDKEVEANAVGVRSRKDGDIGQMKLQDFIEKVQKEVEPDGTEAVKYLKGETLTGDTGMSAPCEKGWVLICTGNLSLGWGKMAAGIIKNHYPKGLRWM